MVTGSYASSAVESPAASVTSALLSAGSAAVLSAAAAAVVAISALFAPHPAARPAVMQAAIVKITSFLFLIIVFLLMLNFFRITHAGTRCKNVSCDTYWQNKSTIRLIKSKPDDAPYFCIQGRLRPCFPCLVMDRDSKSGKSRSSGLRGNIVWFLPIFHIKQ